MSRWPLRPLEEVLTPYQAYIHTPELKIYPKLSVKLYGKGVVLDSPVDGSTLKMKKHQIAKSGQVILSEIWGKKGAIGFVPPEGDGALCTSHFFLFGVHRDKLDPQYLQAIFTANFLQDQLDIEAKGTTGYAAVRPKNLLATRIPLPPLPEQQRIVARIESLVAKIEKARTVRGGTIGESKAILAAEELKIWPEENLRNAQSLEDVTTFLARGRQSEQGESDHFLIKSQHVQMGKYIPTVLKLASYVASKVAPEAFLRDKDILIACSAAGCLGRVAFYNDSSQKASTDTHVAIARPHQALVIPEYLFAYLRGVQGQVQLRSREKGDWTREKIGFRLTELNVADMRRIPVPVPPISEQRRIVTYLAKLRAKVDVLNQLQAEITTELNALLPSILDKAFKGEL